MTILRISDVIEDRHATSLLACLYMRGKMPKTTLAHSVSTNPRMGMKIDRLQDLGFITATKDGRRIQIELTPKGRTVARSLCLMEREVYGDLGDPGHVYEGASFLCSGKDDITSDWYATSKEMAALGPHEETRVRAVEEPVPVFEESDEDHS